MGPEEGKKVGRRRGKGARVRGGTWQDKNAIYSQVKVLRGDTQH